MYNLTKTNVITVTVLLENTKVAHLSVFVARELSNF